MARLQAYHWPGNVRELENAVARALILSGGAQPGAAQFRLEDAPAAATRVEVTSTPPNVGRFATGCRGAGSTLDRSHVVSGRRQQTQGRGFARHQRAHALVHAQEIPFDVSRRRSGAGMPMVNASAVSTQRPFGQRPASSATAGRASSRGSGHDKGCRVQSKCVSVCTIGVSACGSPGRPSSECNASSTDPSRAGVAGAAARKRCLGRAVEPARVRVGRRRVALTGRPAG